MRFSILFILIPIFAQAEYRAYELSIFEIKDPSKKRTVLSILDPDQYPGYYPLKNTETLQMTDTWMCWGYTAYNDKICPNPRLEKRQPASENKNSINSPK